MLGKKISASHWYFLVSVVVLSLKFWAYLSTGSHAILSDAAESVVNVIAASVSIILLNLGREPADRNHPYGHGKFEDVSATLEGILIFLTAIALVYTGVISLLGQPEIHDLDFGLVISFGATLLNLLLARYLVSQGKKTSTPALIASGHHVFSDVWTTFGILFGLGLVQWTGQLWIDGALTLLMGFLLFRTSFQILRHSIGDLMDEMDPDLVKNLVNLFERYRFSGAIDLHHFRILKSGKFHHVDAHLVVPEFWTIQSAHVLVDEYERRIQNDYPFQLELAVHLDPCRQSYCRICDYPECPIRVNPFENKKSFHRERVLRVPPPDEVV